MKSLFPFLVIIHNLSASKGLPSASTVSLRGNSDPILSITQNKTLSRKLEWVFVEQTIDNDEWYTYYDSSEVTDTLSKGKADVDDYLRYTDICPNTETKTYSYDNCHLIQTPDCSVVEDRQPDRNKWGKAKLCINRAPFTNSNTTLFYVSAMKCVPMWENCDKCQCGVIEGESHYGKCKYHPGKGQNPTDDRWDDDFCENLDDVRIKPAESKKMSFEPFEGKITTVSRTEVAENNELCPIGELGCDLPVTDGRITMKCHSCKAGQCGYSESKDRWTCKTKCFPYCGENIVTNGTLNDGDLCPIGSSECEYPDESGLAPAHCTACKSQVCGHKNGNWKCRCENWPECGKSKPPANSEPGPIVDGVTESEEEPTMNSLEKGEVCPIGHDGCEQPSTLEQVKFHCTACKSGYCGYSEKKPWTCRDECWPCCNPEKNHKFPACNTPPEPDLSGNELVLGPATSPKNSNEGAAELESPSDSKSDSQGDLVASEPVPMGSLEKGAMCPIGQSGCVRPSENTVKFSCDACQSNICGFTEKKKLWKCRIDCWPNC